MTQQQSNFINYKGSVVAAILKSLRESERIDAQLSAQLKLLAQINQCFLPCWKNRSLTEGEKQHLINQAYEWSQLYPVSVPEFTTPALVNLIPEKVEKLGEGING